MGTECLGVARVFRMRETELHVCGRAVDPGSADREIHYLASDGIRIRRLGAATWETLEKWLSAWQEADFGS